MKTTSPSQAVWSKRLHFGAAALVTAAIVFLHIVNLQHAGGLWRDEAAAVRLAEMPSFAEVWTHLEHESFPLLVTMSLRGWNAVGFGGSDFGLRVFGFCVGMAILTIIWWNAWTFSSSPPGFSLFLFGLSGTTIRWSDSLRAYGLGVFFALLTFGLVWRVLRSPSRCNVLMAMASSVLSVQTLYQNGFVLAAILFIGAFTVALQKDFRRALLVISLGLPAALSLLPYILVIKRANEWNVATQTPIGFARIREVLSRALSDPSQWLLWLWGAVIAAALARAIYLVTRGENQEARERGWFFVGVMIASATVYYVFLKLAKFPTEVWYYLLLMAVVAVAADALIVRMLRVSWARLALSVVMLATTAFLFSDLREHMEIRMTNVDLIAQQLNRDAAPGDLVLVHPWFCGATFHRYYSGPAPWLTIPPGQQDGLQRLDRFKAQMQIEDPIEPVLTQAEEVLRKGGTVWLVGYFIFLNPPQPPPSLPRPGEGPEGWREEPYMQAYGMQTTYFLQKNAARGRPVEIPIDQKVNPFENLPLSTVTGWRERY